MLRIGQLSSSAKEAGQGPRKLSTNSGGGVWVWSWSVCTLANAPTPKQSLVDCLRVSSVACTPQHLTSFASSIRCTWQLLVVIELAHDNPSGHWEVTMHRAESIAGKSIRKGREGKDVPLLQGQHSQIPSRVLRTPYFVCDVRTQETQRQSGHAVRPV